MQALMTRWDSWLATSRDNGKVWRLPTAIRVLSVHLSGNTFLGIGMYVNVFFETDLLKRITLASVLRHVIRSLVWTSPFQSFSTRIVSVTVCSSRLLIVWYLPPFFRTRYSDCVVLADRWLVWMWCSFTSSEGPLIKECVLGFPSREHSPRGSWSSFSFGFVVVLCPTDVGVFSSMLRSHDSLHVAPIHAYRLTYWTEWYDLHPLSNRHGYRR